MKPIEGTNVLTWIIDNITFMMSNSQSWYGVYNNNFLALDVMSSYVWCCWLKPKVSPLPPEADSNPAYRTLSVTQKINCAFELFGQFII